VASKTVQWVSCANLSCAAALPANVILCTTLGSIPAQIITVQRTCGCDGENCLRYTFLYDETKAFEEAGFNSSNITGAFCSGCITDYILEQAPKIVNEVTYVDSHDFLADPDTPFSLNLSALNSSPTKPMQAFAQWGYVQNFNSTNFGDLTGLSAQLYVDGNPIPTFVNAFAGITVPPVNITISSGTGAHPFIIIPGVTASLTLTLTPVHGALLPDIAWLARYMYLLVYGVTT